MSSSSTKRTVSFASISPNNLGTVRKLNASLFPIQYSGKFYKDILSQDLEDFCRLVYYNDIPVGTICCRLESKDGQHLLYIMTMGILAPYRSRAVGSKTLESVLAAAASHSNPKIDKIYLHVQVSNHAAKSFYERHGFQQVRVDENYYKKIQPQDAWVLEKSLS